MGHDMNRTTSSVKDDGGNVSMGVYGCKWTRVTSICCCNHA